MKEIQIRPNTGDHDVKKKLDKINEALSDGEIVEVVLKFKGREKNHEELGTAMLQRIAKGSKGTSSAVSKSDLQMKMTIKPR